MVIKLCFHLDLLFVHLSVSSITQQLLDGLPQKLGWDDEVWVSEEPMLLLYLDQGMFFSFFFNIAVFVLFRYFHQFTREQCIDLDEKAGIFISKCVQFDVA